MQTLLVVWKTGKLDSSGKNVCFAVQMLIADKIIVLSLHTQFTDQSLGVPHVNRYRARLFK